MPGDQEDKECGFGFLGFKKREGTWAVPNTPSDLQGENDTGFLDEVRGQELGVNGSFEGRPKYSSAWNYSIFSERGPGAVGLFMVTFFF